MAVPNSTTVELHSPASALHVATYHFPMSEEQHEEFADTVEWVLVDNPAVRRELRRMGGSDKVADADSLQSVQDFCNRFNRAVVRVRRSYSNPDQRKRGCHLLVEHILEKCYRGSVKDPKTLNNYKSFSPEVYGECSFDLVCDILDRLPAPLNSRDQFVDLGSGVGQVVLQVSALTDCSLSLGVERADIPAECARKMEESFLFWMAFHGKLFSPFELAHRDFLETGIVKSIKKSTVVFTNNVSFGPELDHDIKYKILCDLADGTNIFSANRFSDPGHKVNDHNVCDLGSIMDVKVLPCQDTDASWTGRDVLYHQHVVTRKKRQQYFDEKKMQQHVEAKKKRRSRRAGNGGG